MAGREPNAASVALFRDGAVLVVRRAREPMAGLWTLPGGRREPGEGIEETARREVAEELGIEVAGLRLVTHSRVPGWTLAVFASELGADVTPTPSDEVSDWRWVHEMELAALETTPDLADVLALALHGPKPLA